MTRTSHICPLLELSYFPTAPFFLFFTKNSIYAILYITIWKEGEGMLIEIDFNSDEAIYVQLCNQIIMGIATDQLKVGETLPSVRQLADTIGINMHTVNKAYSVLRQEGFLSIDRRRGAVISIDVDKIRALEEMKENLLPVLAKGCCKNITREDVHALIDEIFEEYK